MCGLCDEPIDVTEKEEADNLKTLVRIACLALLAMIFAACSGGGNTIDVSLSEWQVDPAPSTAKSGDVEFSVTNDGGEQHEMLIVKDIAPGDLPVDADGHVVEDDIPGWRLDRRDCRIRRRDHGEQDLQSRARHLHHLLQHHWRQMRV